MGYVLTNGPEPMRDLDDARRWYRASAELGCPEGNLGYALALMPRATADYDWRLIRMHLKAAADAGLPTALYVLGALTERGSGGPRDAAGALEFYRRAAEKGNCAAQFRLGVLLMEGQQVPQDKVTGKHGCGAPRCSAISRRRSWSPIFASGVAGRPRIMPMPRAGLFTPPRLDTKPPPELSDRCTLLGPASRKTTKKRPNGCAFPPRLAIKPLRSISRTSFWKAAARRETQRP